MRKTGMRLLAVLLAVVMVLPSVLIPGMAAEATGFTDVPEGSWYGDAVNYVSEKGYMTGVGDNRFAPNDEVTRAMFVTILARITMAETDGTVSAFTDVPVNKWYTGAVSWAAENGIVNGVGGGMFAPGKSITRQDLCTILYRFVNAMDYELTVGEEKTFTDSASVSSYAAEAVRYASSVGLIAGYDDGTFRPKATATRAQMAVIIMRLARLLDGQIVKPEPMPAQSFNGAAGDDMTVSVNAPEGALPENTKMTVSRVTDEAALAELASKVGAEVLGAADISFAKDGAELEPARKVSVRIALDAIQSAKNPAVVHVKDDGSFEYVSSSVVTTRGKADAIEFEADSFSVYAVTDNQTNATLTISFYAQTRGTSGGWEIVNKQIIRANQLGTGKYPIADPGVPGITTSQAFEGWIQGASSFNSDFTYGNDATTKTVKQINEDYQVGLTGNTEIVYYAAVYDVIYVTYHDQAGAVLMSEFYHKNGSNEASVTINWPYVPFTGGYTFTGWTPDIVDMGNAPTYSANPTVHQNGDSVTISDTLDLYPYVQEGHWITFDNNLARNNTANRFDDPTTAKYIPPQFFPTGVNTQEPQTVSAEYTPHREGYTLDGWYKDAEMTQRFTFGQQLTSDTTLYAKWTPASTTYSVVFWKQKATDNKDASNSEKTYDFDTIVTRSATACSGVQITTSNSGTTADNRRYGDAYSDAKYYFTYNSTNSDTGSVKVRGDGGTVLNVYYDRRLITYSLLNGKSGSTYENLTGLYGSWIPNQEAYNLTGTGYTWWYHDGSQWLRTAPGIFQFNAYRLSKTTNVNVAKDTEATGLNKPLHFIGQDLNGAYTYSILEDMTQSNASYVIAKIAWDAFTCVGYNLTTDIRDSSKQLAGSYTAYDQTRDRYAISMGGSTSDAYFYFTRNKYDLVFISNNTDVKTENIYYEKSLLDQAGYIPTNGPEECFFDGWYADPSFDKPFNFNTTMPNANVQLYAKWTPKKYRVILNNVSPSDGVTAASGAQASFLVNGGERIDRNALENFTCDGKQLLGWYTDPGFQHPFNPESLIYDTVSDVNTYYGEKMPGETDADYKARMNGATRTGTDSITNASWDDRWDTDNPDSYAVQRTVRSQLQLYAKWRVDPEGVVGIKVRYLGDHAENDKGYFETSGKPHTVTMDEVYTDQALAAAHSATVPSLPDEDTPDVGRRFLYWEILDKYGNPTGEIVYPGAPFTIDINKAVEIKTPLPDPNCTHTNEGASTIASVAAVAPTCTGTGVAAHYKCTKCGRLFTDANGANETTLDALTVHATGHDWNTNTPTYEWSVSTFNEYTVPTCTATVVCHNDVTHKLTETVTGQLIVNGETGYYLAEFEDEHFADQQSSTFKVNRIAVTFKANGETIDELTQLVTSGQTVTLPGSEYLPAFTGYTFVGWVQAVVSDTTNAPAYKDPGATSDAITAPTTFHALYSHDVDTGSGTETVYELLTEEPDNWAGKFVISYGKTDGMYVLKGLSSNAVTYETTNGCATLTAAGITRDGTVLRNVGELYVFETGYATGYESYRYFQNVSTGGYLSMYKANSSSDTQLYNYSSGNLYTTGLWQPAYNTANGNVTLLNYYYGVAGSDSYPYVSFNSSRNYFYSGSSSGTNTNSIYLWKETQVSNTVPSYTTNPGSGGNAVTQPNLSSGKADSSANLTNLSANANPNPVTATTDKYEKVTSLEAGKKYVLVFKNSSNADYIVTNLNTSSSYGEPYAAPITITADGNYFTITTTDSNISDISNCQLKSGGSSGAWTLESVANEGYYLGIYRYTTYSTTSYYAAFVNTATTWNWNSSKKLVSGSNQLTWYYNNSYYYINLSNSGNAFDFYKLVEDTTYTVTVDSSITNGTVTASPTSQTAGNPVTLTVTPDTGYEIGTVTYTLDGGSAVTITPVNGVYSFPMPAANVTVSATFSSVATHWKVSFVDEDGKAIPGMNDILVPKDAPTLYKNMLPNPDKTDYYFRGWYQGNTECTFPMTVNSDIVLTPKYSPKYAYDYTITLRAVYGPFNPDATTHIYWYANNGTVAHNGAGERFVSTVTESGSTTERLPINAQVDIPYPTGSGSQLVFVGDKGGDLTWEDHVFLGWARVDNGGTADYAEAQILTPDDIYLKWTGDHYEYRKPDGTFSENWTMQQVYADETTPYHDMYAVWAGFYYIYHSSDGTLEAVQLTGTKQVDETTGKTTLVPATKNLVSMVKDGYLYGGYYKSYRGAQTIAGGEAYMKSQINSEVLQSTGFWDYTNGKIADGAINSIDLSAAGAVDYDATTDKIDLGSGPVRLWNKTDAYGKTETGEAWAAVNGSAMTPVAGEIYYLREVPNAYLPNVALAICDEKDESGHVTDQISKVYVLSASDELLYTTTQFSLAEDKVKATVSKKFIVDYREPNPDGNGYTPKTMEFTPAELREGLDGKIGWVLSYEIPVANLKTGTGLVVKPSWTTYDGVTIYGDEFTYKITSDGKTLERNN